MDEQTNEPRLKPVTFINEDKMPHRDNVSQQIALAEALKITQDPEKLKQMIGVRKVSDVYRTLDKMAMRKEYHSALDRAGISFDYIVEKTKNEIESVGVKSADKLNALKMLLKSLGMDRYEQDGSVSGGGWEDLLVKAVEKKGQKQIEAPKPEYEVVQPKIPESIRIMKEAEKKAGEQLYG